MRTEAQKITVANVKQHTFKPEIGSAEIHQIVESIYDKRQINSGGLFGVEEFKLEEGQKFQSERVAFIDVPLGVSVEEVQKRIDALPNAKIIRIMSDKPILSENQKAAIDKGITTLEKIADRQMVRNSETGELVLRKDTGKPFYSKKVFSPTGEADVDMRKGFATTDARIENTPLEEKVAIADEVASA